MDEKKIAAFDKALMELAEKHHIYNPELKTLFSYNRENSGIRYQIPDLPNNLFIKEAKALFDAHFRQDN
ncbi:MAG: hypothetical protein NVSMB24_06620 [Mucilaginibacter sp.]